MLNPSTADAYTNDATIRRCIGFAQAWGYGSLEVVNLFALMATRPQQLQQVCDPIGVDCDRHLLVAVSRAAGIVIAWGNWGRLHQRDRSVLDLLAAQTSPASLYCLGTNQGGQPRHPLYLNRDTDLIPFLRSETAKRNPQKAEA
jgi:hypothetical protein